MIHKILIQVPATTREVIDSVTCEICGEKIENKDNIEVDEITIRRKKGEQYPECGFGEMTEVDMCGKCFEEKFLTWLWSYNGRPRISEWENEG
jgi:hypothetical protein